MRFSKPPYPTVYFSKDVWIRCPKCTEPALVKTELPKYTIPFPWGYKSTCNCSYCGFQESNDDNWSGFVQGIVNRACGNCGTKILGATEPTREPYKSLELKCDLCQATKAYELKWHRYRSGKATDPYFGFDLWFQVGIKKHVLWLYNIEHLNYLSAYVQAKLREDDGRHKYSMITNLPQWVKSSKNRDLIVNKLKKLKNEFEKKTVHNTL